MPARYRHLRSQHFNKWAEENSTPIQFAFLTPDIPELAQAGLGTLLRKMPKMFIESAMHIEVAEIGR